MKWHFTLFERAKKEIIRLNAEGKSLPETSGLTAKGWKRKSAAKQKGESINLLPELMYKVLLYAKPKKLSYRGALKAEIIRLKYEAFEEEKVSDAEIEKRAIANLVSWGIFPEKK